MKRWLIALNLLAAGWLAAEPPVLREGVLPGAEETPEWYAPASFTAAPAESGTLTMWVRPEKWDAQDTGIYSVAELGSRKENAPGLEFYRQNNDSLRVLWFRDMKTQVGDILVKSPAIPAGKWTHFALTWQSNGKTTMTRLWINGKNVDSRWLNFVWGGNSAPRKWRFNDSPAWAKSRTKHRIAVGKVALYDRVLSADELELQCREKASFEI